MVKGSYGIHILRAFLIAFLVFLVADGSSGALSAATANDSPVSPVIIMGFVGGFVRHDDLVHDEVRFAARLRKEYSAGVDVETFENRNGENAHQRILTLLDTNHDRKLSAEEKQTARIILYGHSWGASEVVALALRLEKDSIPVLLTIQVDSISKFGENDEIIPANVMQAANFYQADGLLRGASRIRAADVRRTRILGNFRLSYAKSPYACADYPWYARTFMKAHTQIECDPKVWQQVDSLIRSTLSGVSENALKQDASQ